MRLLAWIIGAGLWCAAGAVIAVQKEDGATANKAKDEKKSTTKASSTDDALAALYPQATDAHKALVKADEGVWDTTMRFYSSGPNQPPQEFKGVETARAIADGLFIVTEFEADFVGGKKFKGHGITGYDVQKKKLVGVWADNMGTSIGTLSGDFDPQSKTVTLWFEFPDQTSGQMRKDKHVIEYKAEGHKLYTMHASQAGGQPVKIMEVESKRRTAAAEAKADEKKSEEKKAEKK